MLLYSFAAGESGFCYDRDVVLENVLLRNIFLITGGRGDFFYTDVKFPGINRGEKCL